MEKRIAIITGASGGIGREFTKLMMNEKVDEIWAIARNREKLETLRTELGDKVIIIPKDLSNLSELRDIEKMLHEQNPIVAYLINNAGLAKMGEYNDFSQEEIYNTVIINCNVPVTLCTLCIPYMGRESRILNISSASAFQPLPYLSLYAATKAFERSYSRALNVELKGMGITATAVCPGWVDTDLLMKEMNGKTVKFDGLVTPNKVCKKALKDAKRGKDMSVCTIYVKFEHLMAKIFPQRMSMNTWLRKIRKYL